MTKQLSAALEKTFETEVTSKVTVDTEYVQVRLGGITCYVQMCMGFRGAEGFLVAWERCAWVMCRCRELVAFPYVQFQAEGGEGASGGGVGGGEGEAGEDGGGGGERRERREGGRRGGGWERGGAGGGQGGGGEMGGGRQRAGQVKGRQGAGEGEGGG